MQNLKAHIELRLGTKVSPKKKVEAKSAQNIFKHVYRKKTENMKAAITNISNEEKRLEP